MAKEIDTCSGCHKPRHDLQSCGKDYNGDPDAPELCFICRKESARGRIFNLELHRYESIHSVLYQEEV